MNVFSALKRSRASGSTRSWLIGGALAASAVKLASIFGQHYAVSEWLFFRYAVAWAGAFTFGLASLSVGNLIVTRLTRPGERQDGHVTLSFATGVYAFFLTTFVVGWLHLLEPVAFFLIPLGLFALGAPQLSRDLLAWWRRGRHGAWFGRLGFWEALGFAFGVTALVFLYIPTLIPENTSYDARWYHLGLAEHYVAAGGIERFPEGATLAAIPHLASILYAWAFLAPGVGLFEHVVLATHIEFLIFLFTLAGVPVLARYLVPGARLRMAWVALFFFPAIFLYDATLLGAADHVAALFAIPTYLLMARAFRDLRPSACLLLAVQLAGLAMSKYTAVVAAVFPVGVVLLRAAFLGFSRLRSPEVGNGFFFGPFTTLVAGVVLTAPHWLKNWIWYGDPVYPILHRHLTLRPWVDVAPRWYASFEAESWAAAGPPIVKFKTMLRGLYDYSLAIYNWPDFHGAFPIVGSLFTFGLVAVPLLRGTRRVFWLVVAGHCGIAVWSILFAYDRYLQPLVPWMAASVSALAVLAFRTGFAAALGVVLLGAVQLVWSLDMPLWPLHKMTAKSAFALAADFFGQSYEKQFRPRTRPFEHLASIGRAIPDGSKILLHHEHVRLGVRHQTVWDWPRFQFGISYGSLGTSRELHRLLRRFGVTHVVWSAEQAFGDDSIASELVFHTYVSKYLSGTKPIGAKSVGEVPAREPPTERPLVFYFGCDAGLAGGLYLLSDLHVSPIPAAGFPNGTYPPPRRPLSGDVEAMLVEVDRAVVDQRCPNAPALAGFDRVARHGTRSFFARARAE